MHTLLFFSFFFFLSLTAFLSFCLCFISQLGGCLSVIITFAIKSKQRGWIEECMPDLPFSTPSAILIVVGLLFFLSSAPFNKWSGVFFKGQIYWQSSCCEGSTSPRGPVSEWKPLLSLYTYIANTLPWPVCQWRWLHVSWQIWSRLRKCMGRRHKWMI